MTHSVRLLPHRALSVTWGLPHLPFVRKPRGVFRQRLIFLSMTVFFVALLQVITPRSSTSGKIAIPPDSMMAATVMATELRVLPELPDVPRTTGVDTSDQLYQTARS